MCVCHRDANEVLQVETDMFESYIKRIDPKEALKSLEALAQIAMEKDAAEAALEAETESRTSETQRGSKSRVVNETQREYKSRVVDKPKTVRKPKVKARGQTLLLSVAQKCDIAEREIEDYTMDTHKKNEKSFKELDNLSVSIDILNMKSGSADIILLV